MAGSAPADVTNLPPMVTELSPRADVVHALVNIRGSNLLNVASISFNGVSAPVYGSTADGTLVQTEVPDNATTGPVVVVTPGGTATSPQDFQVLQIGAPVITSFAPTSGQTGTSVTLTGSNLVEVTGVQFNGVEAEFTTFVGLLSIVPTNASTGPITVTTKYGTYSTSTDFTVIGASAPSVSSFSPGSGTPGTMIQITGSNLVGVTSVLFNGVPSQNVVPPMVEGLIAAEVPLGASTGPITVVTPNGRASSTDAFTVTPVPAPVITGLEPSSAKPGDWMTIMGSNLVLVQSVRFSGVIAEFHENFGTSISARVPYVTSGPVSLANPGGTAVSSENFTVIGGPPPPQVLHFSPTNGVPGTWVTLIATNLSSVDRLSFNGTEAEFVMTADGLSTVVPALATSGPITVETAVGTTTTGGSFNTYNTGELSLFNEPTAATVFTGRHVKFSITVTNVGSLDLQGVVLTNTLAEGQPAADEFQTSSNGFPYLKTLQPADITFVGATTSQGTSTFTNGVLTCTLGTLSSAASANMSVEVTSDVPKFLHLLSVATTDTTTSTPVMAAAMSSVTYTDSIELQVQRIDADQVEVSWVESDKALKLQSAPAPLPTSTWVDVPEPVTPKNGRNTVVITPSSACQFYRLVQSTP
jgi:hypothetical protein